MKDSDLEITVGCAAAHPDRMGGQHVAKQCTGVRITHKPTGLTLMIDSERSQHRNKELALAEMQKALDLLDRNSLPTVTPPG